jgi:hypothetical protein
MLHRSDQWHALVRPVDRASQAGGYSSHIENILGSLCDSSRPWNKTTTENITCKGREPYTKPSQTPRNLPRTYQQQHTTTQNSPRRSPNANPTKGLHRSDRSRAPVRPVTPGQLGMNNNPWINSSKSNSRCPDSLHGFAQDFWDSRNASWALHSQDLVHQNLLEQEESKKSHQERL